MKKAEFETVVDELLLKVGRIEYFNYSQACNALALYKNLAIQYADVLPSFYLEEFGSLEISIDEFFRAKLSQKHLYWNKFIKNLIFEVECLKYDSILKE